MPSSLCPPCCAIIKILSVTFSLWQGRTPLFLAVLYGHPQAVEWLLRNGADVGKAWTLQQRYMASLFIMCARAGKLDAANNSVFHAAAFSGKLAIIKLLVGIMCFPSPPLVPPMCHFSFFLSSLQLLVFQMRSLMHNQRSLLRQLNAEGLQPRMCLRLQDGMDLYRGLRELEPQPAMELPDDNGWRGPQATWRTISAIPTAIGIAPAARKEPARHHKLLIAWLFRVLVQPKAWGFTGPWLLCIGSSGEAVTLLPPCSEPLLRLALHLETHFGAYIWPCLSLLLVSQYFYVRAHCVDAFGCALGVTALAAGGSVFVAALLTPGRNGGGCGFVSLVLLVSVSERHCMPSTPPRPMLHPSCFAADGW